MKQTDLLAQILLHLESRLQNKILNCFLIVSANIWLGALSRVLYVPQRTKTHSLLKYLLSTCYGPAIVLDAGAQQWTKETGSFTALSMDEGGEKTPNK